MLTLKQLAYLLGTTTYAITYRAKRGMIPGAVKSGSGKRTRWTFPDEAAHTMPPAPKREEPGRLKTRCSHCGAIFTTATNYSMHRWTKTIGTSSQTICLDPIGMRLRGLWQNQRGEWTRTYKGPAGPFLPSQERTHPEAD